MFERKFSRVAVLAFLSLVLAFRTEAQRPTEKPSKSVSYFLFGGNILAMDNLNERLTDQSRPDVSERFLSIGIAGHTIKNRLVLGGEAHQLFGDSVTRDNFETSLSASYGFVNIGYAPYTSDNLDIYPLAGIGLGRLRVKLLNQTSASFDEVLARPERSVVLTTRNFLINLALGVDYVVRPPKNRRESQSGLLLGLRVGYTLALNDGDWNEEGIDIDDGPETGITGPYVRLVIGTAE